MKTLAMALGLLLATVASASAALVFEGEISNPTEVDWIFFNVDTPGWVTIDVLADEMIVSLGGSAPSGDLNGDGVITNLDTEIFLFSYIPGLNVSSFANIIAGNDNTFPFVAPGFGGNDGSTSLYDSFLSMPLSAGDYFVAIGAWNLNESDARWGSNPYGDSTGAYRITITGAYEDPGDEDPGDEDPGDEDPVVPEPATVALIGLGLTGLAAGRRRRKV